MPIDYFKKFLGGKESEKKLSSPAEELKELHEKYEEKKTGVEKLKETVEPEKIGDEVIKEHAEKAPEKILDKKYKIPEEEEKSLVVKILELSPEDHDSKVDELLGIAEQKGIANALSVVRKLKDPHLEDDFHRALVQVYLNPHLKFDFKKPFSQALGMTLFEVTFPQEEIKENNKVFKDFISAMKNFYSGMSIIQEDTKEASYFALELGLPATGEEIVFYIAVSRRRKHLLEKQINALFPNAKIEEKKEDYNIFKFKGVNAGAIASLKSHPVLPIKTYDKFDVDPLTVIINSFSKLQKSGEGAAFQIIVSPEDNSFNKQIKLVAEDVRKGKSFQDALKNTKGIVGGVFESLGEFVSGPQKHRAWLRYLAAHPPRDNCW